MRRVIVLLLWGHALGHKEQHRRNFTASNVLCANYELPKVAWCISGSVRSFVYPVVHSTMKTNLIDAFGGESYVFFDLRLSDSRTDPRKEFGGLINDTSEHIVRSIIADFNPVDVRIQHSSPEPIHNPKCDIPWLADFLLPGALGQFASVESCFDLVTNYEKQHNLRFDAVARVRPDTAWASPVPAFCRYDSMSELKEKVLIQADFIDHFFWAPRAYADVTFKLLTDYKLCNEARPKSGAAEWYFLEVMRKANVPFTEKKFPLVIVRKHHKNYPVICDHIDKEFCESHLYNNRLSPHSAGVNRTQMIPW